MIDLKDISNGSFYITRDRVCIKVIDKDFKAHFSGRATLKVETQRYNYKVIKETCFLDTIIYECRRTQWDKLPREKEPASFHLKEDYTTPTDTHMYYCRHCKEDDLEHEIIDIPAPGVWLGSYMQCTSCKRKSGPWVPYGDD